FQAEDGIRDFHVTGVQTCALPILTKNLFPQTTGTGFSLNHLDFTTNILKFVFSEYSVTPSKEPHIPELPYYSDRRSRYSGRKQRSEERRVGKQSMGRWWPCV